MTVLVFGADGQVGLELAAKPGVTAIGREAADLATPSECADKIAELRPEAVINAAAFTAVDQAERDRGLARLINGSAPEAMARACQSLDIPFVTLSSDYVFDGSGHSPWAPDAPMRPLNAYGQTKAVGEDAVRAVGGRYAVLRTSWLFSAQRTNFVKTMLRIGQEKTVVEVVDDQIGGPTPASSVAAACIMIAEALIEDPQKAGTYHFSGSPDVSWAAFAQEIFRFSGLNCCVRPVTSKFFESSALRPLNSRLDCRLTEQVFSIPRPDWRVGLTETLKNLGF